MEVKNEEDEALLLQPSNVAAPKPRRPTRDHLPYAAVYYYISFPPSPSPLTITLLPSFKSCVLDAVFWEYVDW